jgi:hypothetical protein
MDGVTCCTGWIWCCKGEVSGEPLEREERSEAEWMECSYKARQQNWPLNGLSELRFGAIFKGVTDKGI